MKYRISTSNERVWCTTQLAKLSFNHSIGRTHSWRFYIFYKIRRQPASAVSLLQKTPASCEILLYCSATKLKSQLYIRKNHSFSRSVQQQHHHDLERVHTAVITFWLGIEQNPTGMCYAACYWNRKKKSYRLPTSRYRLKKRNISMKNQE